MNKLKVIHEGFNAHDAESRYRCPVCHKPFGSWDVYHNTPNENGSKEYCPFCKTELEGLA